MGKYWKLVLFALIAATLLARLSTNSATVQPSRARFKRAFAIVYPPSLMS
jgi:hypothetical protein